MSGDRAGDFNIRRFVNTLDYSLDLIKLREVYEKVYRNMRFSFNRHGKEFCEHVINVTFKYSVKEFNRFPDKTYIKFGFTPADVAIEDCVCVKDGELIAIRTDEEVKTPLDESLLNGKFTFENGVYKLGTGVKVLYTVAQLREKLYKDGFICDGIKFRRFKRSSGSSRVGKCLFINERLYPAMHKWALCGLKVKDGEAIDLAAFESYIALTLSSIIDTLHLYPENFLVIDDYKSVFKDKAVVSRLGDDGWLQSLPEEIEIQNSIWDGQSLIDKSAMGKYDCYGMILLRNRFFKSACFNTNIQQFFADNHITDVRQLNGFTLAKDIKDIKIITTPSSIKYVKFGKLKTWLSLLEKDGEFGVVKHEKPTHFFDGRMVQIHYQLINTLQMTQEEVDELVKPSLDYLHLIQTDPAVLRYYIKYGNDSGEVHAASTSNDVVYQMLGVTDKFAETKLYNDFKHDIVHSFKKNLRRGHILVSGNYSTLFGNPVEMLQASIAQFYGESQLGVGNIHSKRFEYDRTILGSRSPHVTMGNVWLTRNVADDEIDKYFNLTNEIVCINSIEENILMRLSGADFDSDTALLTDNEILIKAAQKNYDKFLVPTSMVEAKKVQRYYTCEDQSDLDIRTSVNKIGEIVNLSQELNTQFWNYYNDGNSFDEIAELYYDIAKLDVLSGIEIDKAKKEFAVNSVAEIKRMKKKYESRDDDGRKIMPNFLGKIAQMKGYYNSEKKNYKFHDTSMDYLQHSINKFKTREKRGGFIPFSDLLIKDGVYQSHEVWYPQVSRIINLVREMRTRVIEVWGEAGSGIENKEKSVIVASIKEEYLSYIKDFTLNDNTAYRLLFELDKEENKDIARSIFYLLFSLPNSSFLKLLNDRREHVPILEETSSKKYDVKIYGFRFKKIYT